uniref:Uncharacterized protein n=1 Tax=Anguilla anguilla TaxID=7936 RepID=A0A0E9Q714_ANGAN
MDTKVIFAHNGYISYSIGLYKYNFTNKIT